MRVNQEFAVESSRLWLVPYGVHHVPKYHRWMQSEELQLSTSSDPLSIHQEYAAQQQWAELDDRLTFILLSKERLCIRAQTKHNSNASWQQSEEESMIGDVNLFLRPTHLAPLEAGTPGYEGEVSVMIAEKDARGFGLAAEAIAAMLKFSDGHLPVHLSSLVAKVSADNVASLRLFQNRMGFVERSRCSAFNQLELVPPFPFTDSSYHSRLASQTADLILDGLRRTSAEFRATDWRYTEHNLSRWRTELIHSVC